MSEWIDEVIKEIEKIKSWDLKDRLALIAKITFMNGSIASSVTGWQHWLSNALTMENFSEDELKEVQKDFESIALAFLDLDIKYTKLMEKKVAKENKVKESSKKTSYVT